MARPRKQRKIKTLSKDHFIKYRTKRGYTSKKPRGQFIVEVYSKKTKKRIGFLNSIKNKKPLPRKFTSAQLLIKTVKKEMRPGFPKIQKQITFKINSKRLILDQVLERADMIKKLINKKLTQVAVDLITPDGQDLRSEIFILSKSMSKQDIAKLIAIEGIINQLRVVGQRMSPKKQSRTPGYKHQRTAQVTIFTLDL